MAIEEPEQFDPETGEPLDRAAVEKEAWWRAIKRTAWTKLLGLLTGVYLQDYYSADARAYALQQTYNKVREKGEWPAELGAAEARDHFFAENPEIKALWWARQKYPWATTVPEAAQKEFGAEEDIRRSKFYGTLTALQAQRAAEVDAVLSADITNGAARAAVNNKYWNGIEEAKKQYGLDIAALAQSLGVEGYEDPQNIVPFTSSLWGKTPDDIQTGLEASIYRDLGKYMPEREDYTEKLPNGKLVFDSKKYRAALDKFYGDPAWLAEKVIGLNLDLPLRKVFLGWLPKHITPEGYTEYRRRNDTPWEALREVWLQHILKASDLYWQARDEDKKEAAQQILANCENVAVTEYIPFILAEYGDRWTAGDLIAAFHDGDYVMPGLDEWWMSNKDARGKYINRFWALYQTMPALDRRNYNKAYPGVTGSIKERPDDMSTNYLMDAVHSLEKAMGLPYSLFEDKPVYTSEFKEATGTEPVEGNPAKDLRLTIYQTVTNAAGEEELQEAKGQVEGEIGFRLASPAEAQEYDRAKSLNDQAWSYMAAGETEKGRALLADPLVIKWFGQGAKSVFWRDYYGQIPPGTLSEELRADPLVGAVLAKGVRGYLSDQAYTDASLKLKAWVESNPDVPGDPQEWELVRNIVAQYMELRKTDVEAARAYWQENQELLSKYYFPAGGGGRGGYGAGGGGGRGGGGAPRASQTEVWAAVSAALGPLALGRLALYLFQNKALDGATESKLRKIYQKYGTWTKWKTWLNEYLKMLFRRNIRFREPTLRQPEGQRMSLGRWGYTSTRRFIRR